MATFTSSNPYGLSLYIHFWSRQTGRLFVEKVSGKDSADEPICRTKKMKLNIGKMSQLLSNIVRHQKQIIKACLY